MFLYQTKALAIGVVWSLWFRVWTSTDDHQVDEILNSALLHESVVVEFLFETLPQLAVQSINNTFMGNWPPIGIFSTVLSALMAFNGVFYYGYYIIFLRRSFSEVPTNVSIGIPGVIQLVEVDLHRSSKAKSFKVVDTNDIESLPPATEIFPDIDEFHYEQQQQYIIESDKFVMAKKNEVPNNSSSKVTNTKAFDKIQKVSPDNTTTIISNNNKHEDEVMEFSMPDQTNKSNQSQRIAFSEQRRRFKLEESGKLMENSKILENTANAVIFDIPESSSLYNSYRVISKGEIFTPDQRFVLFHPSVINIGELNAKISLADILNGIIVSKNENGDVIEDEVMGYYKVIAIYDVGDKVHIRKEDINWAKERCDTLPVECMIAFPNTVLIFENFGVKKTSWKLDDVI